MKKRNLFAIVAFMIALCAALAGCQSSESQGSDSAFIGTWDVQSVELTTAEPSDTAEAESADSSNADESSEANTAEGETSTDSSSEAAEGESEEATSTEESTSASASSEESSASETAEPASDESPDAAASSDTTQASEAEPASENTESDASSNDEAESAEGAATDTAETPESATPNAGQSAEPEETEPDMSSEPVPVMSPGADAAAIAESEGTVAEEEEEQSFMRFYEDGTAAFNDGGIVISGTWERDGAQAHAFMGADNYDMALDGDELVVTQGTVVYRLVRVEDKDPFEVEDETMSMADENGMSILIDEGEKLGQEITLADDDTCRIVADGVGVAPTGDPGYNLQITNNADQAIIVMTPDYFQVGGKDVMVYLYTTLDAHRSTTSFLQFDTDQIGSDSTDSLKNIEGTIQVTTLEGENLASYDVTLGNE